MEFLYSKFAFYYVVFYCSKLETIDVIRACTDTSHSYRSVFLLHGTKYTNEYLQHSIAPLLSEQSPPPRGDISNPCSRIFGGAGAVLAG